MPIRKKLVLPVLALVLALGFAMPPSSLEAQPPCATNGAPFTGTYTMGGNQVNYILKYLTTSATCNLTMSNNVLDCRPNPGAAGSTLSATAYSSAMSPSCQWDCGAGTCTVTTDGSDGLPVELMDFDIDGE